MTGLKEQQEKNKNKSMVSKLEIDEDAGELLCDKCEGRGCMPTRVVDESHGQTVCSKCQGRGKVDWISHITGVPAPREYAFSSSSFTYSSTSGNGNHCHDDAVDAMAQVLAANIDKEIMDNLLNPTNKHIKMYGQEVKKFDNGIFSKFMFHPDS